MNAETDRYYGRDDASATFKWGVVIRQPILVSGRNHGLDEWKAIAWFKTRKRAEEYAREGWGAYAIARVQGL
jgi:hypothetical protein